jgi:predicted transcriptional regulator
MSKAHLKSRITDRTISEDGEVLDEKTVSYLVENEKDFYMTYCKVLGLMKDMKLGEIKTLAWLVSTSHFNNNMVVVTSGVKKKIAQEMDISESAVNKALAPLVEKEILYRDSDASNRRDGVYYIHPEYYWKGNLAERKRMLRIALETLKK